MILTDKPYIEMPPENTPLMHYLNIYQLLSILKHKELIFSSVSLYEDALEATLSEPSYKEVSKFLLWEDKTPVRKGEGYLFSKNRAKGIDHDFLYRDYWKRGMWEIDTFDTLITQFARHFMFAHCWTIAPAENILMWDRYKNRNATIGIKTTINRMKNAFVASNVPLHVGKINYKNYDTQHIRGFENFTTEDLCDPNIIEKLFYRPVFHKQNVYNSENEVRVIMSYKYATESMIGKIYLTDIPFYDYDWGFEHEHNNYDRSYPLLFKTEDGFVKVYRKIQIEVDIDELIDKIILSPYTESYALPLIQDAVNQYGIDRDKVVNSSIRFR